MQEGYLLLHYKLILYFNVVYAYMKKLSSIVRILCVVFAGSMILTGCNLGDDTLAITTERMPTESASASPTEPPLESNHFSKDYVYRYEDSRDRAWEEDVVFLANAFLGDSLTKGHPLFVDKEIVTYKPGLEVKFQSFYNAQMRAAFILDLELLIRNIPKLSDTQIIYKMQRIVAKLNDLHSYVNITGSDIFVFMAEPFYSDEGMQLRMVRLPIAYEDALYGELVAINGIPIDEVIERLGQYVSHEWEYGKMFNLTSMLSTNLINKKDALQAAGIVAPEDTTAEFEIITEQRKHIVAEIPALSSEEYKAAEKAKGDWFSMGLMSYNDYYSVNYFLRFEEENEMLYIRFNREVEMTDYRFSQFFEDIKTQSQNKNCEKIVVDLRLNGGGNGTQMHDDLIQILSQSTAENIYVLVDSASYSDGVLLSLDLQQNLPNAVIVGTPGGQGPNFFATGVFYTLPNSGFMIAVSCQYFMWRSDYQHETLMPDITIYQTLEDYKQGIDTVLSYIRAKE